jgi:hypothetical protein
MGSDSTGHDEVLSELVGQAVVMDLAGSTIVIGRLVRIGSDCYVLDDADLHDCEEGASGKELYAINVRKYELKSNRRRVYVLRKNVLAVSALDDVITD